MKEFEKKDICVVYFRVIQNMYDEITTSMRIVGGETKDFPIRRSYIKA